MKLAARILFSIFIIIGTGFFIMTNSIVESSRLRYLQGVEESMVDQSVLLSAIVANEMSENRFPEKKLSKIFIKTYENKFSSKIYHLKKTSVDTRVYITDKKGMIIFDSSGKAQKGEDYSNWRDVYLTLRGKYGARSSRENKNDPNSSVLYVAAPIKIKGKIEGVLTIAKPTTNINNFFYKSRKKIILKSSAAALIIFIFSGLVIIFLTRPIKNLKTYADTIRLGKKAKLPNLDKTEIGDMGRAFENMRQALENRKYVEKYVQTLTHEIKSPVSAIKGAAELLGEDMPLSQRDIFLENIKTESERIKMLVDRMLELSALENMKSLNKIEKVDFSILLNGVCEWMTPVISGKKMSLISDTSDNLNINAEPMLIKQAITNLIQNSVDFGKEGDLIKIRAERSENHIILTIKDQGSGIPEFAGEKIYEKFFSMQRPDSGKKSTGLGLNFVKEIVELHGGWVKIKNRDNGAGTIALVSIPLDS